MHADINKRHSVPYCPVNFKITSGEKYGQVRVMKCRAHYTSETKINCNLNLSLKITRTPTVTIKLQTVGLRLDLRGHLMALPKIEHAFKYVHFWTQVYSIEAGAFWRADMKCFCCHVVSTSKFKTAAVQVMFQLMVKCPFYLWLFLLWWSHTITFIWDTAPSRRSRE